MLDRLRHFKAEIFQALGHPTRIAIVDELRAGDLTVSALAERLDAEQSNISQHLAILRARQIVATRKLANQVFYSVRDPQMWRILDLMRKYFEKQVGESVAMLENPEEKTNDSREVRALSAATSRGSSGGQRRKHTVAKTGG